MRFDYKVYGAHFLFELKLFINKFNISEDSVRKRIDRLFENLKKRKWIKNSKTGYESIKNV